MSIGCHRLGQQFELLLSQLKVLFGVLGSEKEFRSNSATGLVEIEIYLLGPLLFILLLRCKLFWLYRVCEGWWPNDMASTIEACLWFCSVQFVGPCGHNQFWHHCPWFPDNTLLTYHLFVGVVLRTWVVPKQSRSYLVTSLPLLAIEVELCIFHRWIELFAPLFSFLSVRFLNDGWHHSSRRRIRCPTIYSTGLLTCPLILRLLL